MEGHLEGDSLKEEHRRICFYNTRETGAIARFFD
jgi:hypothetical protein